MLAYSKFIAAIFGAGAIIATTYGYGGEFQKIAVAIEAILTAVGVYVVPNVTK